MRSSWRRRVTAVVVIAIAAFPLAVDSRAASALEGPSVFQFSYAVDSVVNVKKFDQTIVVPTGSFVGGIDLMTGELEGALSLPETEFTFKLAGVVPLVTATAQVVPTEPVRGYVDFYHLPALPLTATATFNMLIIEAHAQGTNLNLVGDECTTKTPVVVTMAANANLGGPTVMSGTFTLPEFANCGLATPALSLAISGPGNTFTATATPT